MKMSYLTKFFLGATLERMKYGRFLFITALFSIPVFAFAASDVAISEVLFDPAGSNDTGLEYVVIKNFGSSQTNLSGWDLYPDGIGYFTFPDFTLGGGQSVKINLRLSGTNDSTNLYFSSAGANMSNSSGSVALFSGTTHSKDTIISYVRYHKSGSTERKTWETTAASAGIWTAGTFVDISAGAEGKILKLNDFNQRASVSGWALVDASAISQTTQPDQQQSAPDQAIQDASLSGSVAPRPVNQIKAYAGQDRSAIAGADMFFEGFAEGINGDPLEGARFSWNFGDGSALVEGKKVGHAFLYPGNYVISLNVSAGEYSALDTANIAVMESPLVLSEIKTGTDGWAEIKNNSARKIEISRFGLKLDDSKTFFFSENTYLAPYAFLTLATSTLGFSLPPEAGEIKLLYPNGTAMLSAAYPFAGLEKDESLSFSDGGWIKTKATPGAKNEMPKNKISRSEKPGTILQTPDIKNNPSPNDFTASAQNIEHPKSLQDFFSDYFWLFLGLGAGILGGAAFIFGKRYLTKI